MFFSLEIRNSWMYQDTYIRESYSMFYIEWNADKTDDNNNKNNNENTYSNNDRYSHIHPLSRLKTKYWSNSNNGGDKNVEDVFDSKMVNQYKDNDGKNITILNWWREKS